MLPSPRPLRLHLAALLCALAAAALYWNTLECGICYDDEPAIKKNQDLRPHATTWLDLFSHDFWGADITTPSSHKSYRPLTVATFRLNYMLHELQPLGYHLVNVLLHSAVCYLYVLLCGVVFSEVWLALIAGLLFAVHPIHTEAVAGLVGRTELLSGLFFIAAFLTYRRAAIRHTTGLKWLLLTLFLTLCSVLSKEQGITVVAVCLCYDFFCLQQMDVYSGLRLLWSPSNMPRPFLHRSLLLSVFTAAFLALRVKLMKSGPDIFNTTVNPPIFMETPHRQLSWLYLCFVNSWLLLNPFSLCADWRFGAIPVINSLADANNLLTIATFAAVGYLGWSALTRKGRTSKELIFALSLLIFPFIPASNLLFPVGFVVAERILYLPSMGFCILVALGFKRSVRFFDRKWLKLLIFPVLLSLLAFQGVRTHYRNMDWQSNYHVYLSGLRVNPRNVVLLSNLGIAFSHEKDYVISEALYRRAIAVAPLHSKGYANLGGLLEALGRNEEAEWALTKAAEYGPNDDTVAKLVETYQFLIGTVLTKNESKLLRALDIVDHALTQYSDLAELHSLRARVLILMERYREAFKTLELASSTPFMLSSVQCNYGMLYARIGEDKKAEKALIKALQLNPGNFDAMAELGMVLFRGKDRRKRQEGENLIKQAYSNNPKSFIAPYYQAEVHYSKGELSEAQAYLEKANKRSIGTYRHILHRLGELYLEIKDYHSALDVLQTLVKWDADYKNVQVMLKVARKNAH